MFDVANAAGKPQVSVVAEVGKSTNKSNLIALKGGFSTSDQSYKFEIRADFRGEIFYSDFPGDSGEFAHEVKVEKLGAEIGEAIREQIALQSRQNASDASEVEGLRDEISGEMLEEVFWEEINQTLEDSFFRSVYDDGEWGEEFQTEHGTTQEFIEFLELCVLTEREILPSNDDYLVVEAETDYELAGISECSYYTERLEELVEIACEYYKPAGYRYDYNEGCYDRASGYSMSSESVSVLLSEAAREKMLGRQRLKEKLVQMDVPVEKIEKLTAF